MRNFFFLLFFLAAFSSKTFAQDTLTQKDGKVLSVKVLKISPTEIEYKRSDNLDGPLIIILKSDVSSIRYANGTKEEFGESPVPSGSASPMEPSNTVPMTKPSEAILANPAYAIPLSTGSVPMTRQELYFKGQQDALIYYRGHGAMWGTFGAFMGHPIAGVVTGIALAATPPKAPKMNQANAQYLQNPHYVEGYRKQAHKRKIGKAAAGVGIGVGVYLAIIVLFVAASQ